jgi:hypothetical protein
MNKDKRKQIALEIENHRLRLAEKKEIKEARKLARLEASKRKQEREKAKKEPKQKRDDIEYQKLYYLKNKEKIAERKSKKYTESHTRKVRALRSKEPKVKSPRVKMSDQERRDKVNNKVKQKRQTDVQYRLSRSLRARLYKVVKGNQKIGSAVKDLGCTTDFLKTYLESLFQDGMTWDNYGPRKDNWSIDHIEAISTVDLTNEEDFKRVNHYTNLRPLWNKDQIILYHREQKNR